MTPARLSTLTLLAALTATSTTASAADFSVTPLATFAGDGWLAPGEGGYGFLGTGNLERGLAFGNDQLYLVSRAGGIHVRRLDASTGADLGGLDVTGIAGGTFAANMIGVAGDGAIYVGNLSTSAAANFKVYRWADDAATPTVAYDAAPGLPRLGDTFAVTGSGPGTRVAVSGSGTIGLAIIDPTAGTGTAVSAEGTAAGDFRLGLTWVDEDTVIGTQGASIARVLDISGATGTLAASPATSAASERLIGYNIVGGVSLLATVDTATSDVRIYDASDLSSLLLLSTINATSGALAANGNGVGAVAWGPAVGNSANLYAMSANQGIQAFVVTIPEPGTIPLVLLGAAFLFLRRRQG